MTVLAISGSVMMHETGFALADLGDGVACCCKEPPADNCTSCPDLSQCISPNCPHVINVSCSGLAYEFPTTGCPAEVPSFQREFTREGIACKWFRPGGADNEDNRLIDTEDCVMFILGTSVGYTSLQCCIFDQQVYWSLSIAICRDPGTCLLQHYRRRATLDDNGRCCPAVGIYDPYNPTSPFICKHFPFDGENVNVGEPGVAEVL